MYNAKQIDMREAIAHSNIFSLSLPFNLQFARKTDSYLYQAIVRIYAEEKIFFWKKRTSHRIVTITLTFFSIKAAKYGHAIDRCINAEIKISFLIEKINFFFSYVFILRILIITQKEKLSGFALNVLSKL